MSGVHVGGPGPSGFRWHTNIRSWGARAYESYDATEVALMAQAMLVDITACGCDPKTNPVRHATGFASVEQGKAFTYQCPSGCRWYNPRTHRMEGRSHCTCDSCF